MKAYIMVYIVWLFLLASISMADFTLQSSINLNGTYYPSGVAVDPVNEHYWFSHHNFRYENGFSEMDQDFRFIKKVISENSDEIVGFGSITLDTSRNTIWVTDDYSPQIREFTKDGDLVSTFTFKDQSYNIVAGSITYNSSSDSLWLKELGSGSFLYEVSITGEQLKTIRLDQLTTPVYANDVAYDQNRDVLWLYSDKLVKISTDGVLLGMFEWDISQIENFTGMGYNPITDRILITEARDNHYLDKVSPLLWEYTTEGQLIGSNVLSPYYLPGGISVEGNNLWIVSSNEMEYSIAKTDFTGKNLFYVPLVDINGWVAGIIPDPHTQSLWIAGNPIHYVPMKDLSVPKSYPDRIYRYSYSGQYIQSYPTADWIGALFGITRDFTTGHLWLVSQNINLEVYISEYTTSGTLVSSFPIGQTGCTEPRGITYVPDNDRLMVIDDATDSVYCFTKTGQFKWSCSIANITTAPEDISYEAPGIIWILEGQRAIRCFYEPPTSVVPTHWDGYH